MRRFLMGIGTSFLVIGLMYASYLEGILPGAGLLRSAGLVLLACGIFYLIFRSGLNLRCADASLTVPQMVAATLVILYTMYAANGGRAIFLVILLMIFLFGVLRLTIRSLLACAAVTLAGHAGVIGLLWCWRPQALNLRLELLQWCALAITLPWFAVMGGFIGGLRTKLHKRNEELQGLLRRVQFSEVSLAQTQGTMVDAIECLNECFALFDADDRLLLCNRKYVQCFTDFERFEDIAGMCFEDLVRLSLAKGEAIDPAFEGDVQAWVRQRVQRHRHPDAQLQVLQLGGGRWVEVSEQRTRSGGIVGVRRDVSAQKLIEQRQAMEYRVTLLLAESASLAIAMPGIIQTIGTTLGLDCGAFWQWDRQAQALACTESWSSGAPEVAQFLLLNSVRTPIPGTHGLIRRVWTSGEPVWIADVALEPRFDRAGIASQAGLHGAFAFPVRVGSELHGVMEFFTRDACQAVPALLALTRSIGSQIGQFIARKAAEDEIRQLAFYDPLTGLPNRRLLTDRLQHAQAAAIRSKRHGGLLFIDLDHFKAINDTLGHGKGDLLLQQVAERLAGCVRVGDTVARQGGDEFVIMLMDLSAVAQEAALQAEAIGEKILEALNRPYRFAGHVYHTSASIGATLFDGQPESTDEYLKRADLAMYQAKAAGRNTLRFFEADMQAAVSQRAALEADLRQGLQEGQFQLYYQAQICADGRVTGAEALLRWQHPQRGFVAPAEFIPAAEESGLILPLGRWVLETACRQLALWAGAPATAQLSLAVNVSARQFRQPDFVDQVVDLLKRSGADPHRLKLELTESMLIDNVEQIIVKMTALKALGVGFSLDDFGTGYSSLSYLKRLPLDQLKIDQSFVRDVLSDPNDAAIVRTIVALAQSLGLEVIAEGVETALQQDFLAAHGCHAYQGYLYSRPVPLEQFESLNLRHYTSDSLAFALL